MLIRESTTAQGLPRVDWVQLELSFVREPFSSDGAFLGLMASCFIMPIFIAAALTPIFTPIPGGGIHPGAFIVFYLGSLTVLGLVLYIGGEIYNDVRFAKVVPIPNTSYVYGPVDAFMYLLRRDDGYFLRFSGDKQEDDRPLWTKRFNEILSLSVMNAESWEHYHSPKRPHEKLIVAQMDNGDTIVVVRHYGAQGDLANLRTLLQRTFIGWKPPRAVERPTQLYGRAVPGGLQKPRSSRDDDDVI